MNLNILMFMIFFIVVVLLIWRIPDKKLKLITVCIKSLLKVLPITQVIKMIIEIRNKK